MFKTRQVAFTRRIVVNNFNFYELETWSRDLNNGFTLANCLYGDDKLTNNADPEIVNSIMVMDSV